jgi:hypothetical protein
MQTSQQPPAAWTEAGAAPRPSRRRQRQRVLIDSRSVSMIAAVYAHLSTSRQDRALRSTYGVEGRGSDGLWCVKLLAMGGI